MSINEILHAFDQRVKSETFVIAVPFQREAWIEVGRTVLYETAAGGVYYALVLETDPVAQDAFITWELPNGTWMQGWRAATELWPIGEVA